MRVLESLVRRIVREELDDRDRQQNIQLGVIYAQYRSELLAKTYPSLDDGPLVAEIKRVMRTAAEKREGP